MKDSSTRLSRAAKSHASNFPKEVQLATNGLASESGITFAILSVLIEEGPLERDELERALEMEYEEFEDELTGLQRGGLVSKRVGERIGDPQVGAYEITTFGEQLLDGIHEASIPEKE